MTQDYPPPLGPIPELHSTSASAGRIATLLHTITTDLDEVTDWADRRSADGAGWDGDAAEAAGHTSTRFARRFAAAGAALTAAREAATDFEADLAALEREYDDLDATRVALNADILAATSRGAPAANGLLFASPLHEAAELTLRHLALRGAISRWEESVTAAEQRFVAALQAVDTLPEGTAAVATVLLTANLGAHIDDKIAALVTAGILPAEAARLTPEQLRRYLVQHPDVAARLVAHDPSPFASGDLDAIINGARESPEAAWAQFSHLSPRDAALIALLYPDEVGNMNGVPFAIRAGANLVSVVAALARAEYALRQHPDEGFRKELEASRALYESIIRDGRQIILFDESAQKIAELHGTIGPQTRNVGVLVPGTFSDLPGFQEVADRSASFVEANANGDLAMISWQGGEFPPGLSNAAEKGYAETLAPRLAAFSHAVGMEVDHFGAGTGTQITYAGHSYGGAVVGLSETHGLEADRVIHIESAGMGDHVDGPGDLPANQAGVDRYSMTDEDDFISLVQGAPGGHGADPDTFDGNVRLATGREADGRPIEGLKHAHSAVFEPRSAPWRNLYEVFTGGTVTTFDPAAATVLQGDMVWIDEDSGRGKQEVDIR